MAMPRFVTRSRGCLAAFQDSAISHLSGRGQLIKRIGLAALLVSSVAFLFMLSNGTNPIPSLLTGNENRPVLMSSGNSTGMAIDPTTGAPLPSKALVISSYREQDVSWLNDLPKMSTG